MGGDYEAGEAHAERAHRLFRDLFDPGSPVHVRAVQGDAARLSGRLEAAEPIYLECLHGFQEIGVRRCVASTLKNLGLVALDLDRPGEAGGYLTAALERRRRQGDDAGIAECLEGIGLVAQRKGESRGAIRLLAAADRLRHEAGSVAPKPERTAVDVAVRGAGSLLSEETAAVEWDRGGALQTDEVCAEAVHLVDHLSGVPP